MGPFFGPPGLWKTVEDGYDSNEIAYDDYIWAHTRPRWKKVLNARIFSRLGIKGDCDKIDFNGKNYALYYSSPNQKEGYFINPSDQKNCASGGIVMSPRDMGVFLHALTQTNKIITHKNYLSLMRITSTDRIAWNGSFKVSDGSRAFWKAGAWNPPGSLSTIPGNTATGSVLNYIIDYPNGMGVVFAANSGKPMSRFVRETLRDAYNAAVAAASPGPRRRLQRDGG